MLFVISHKHGAESCPAGTIRPVKNFPKKIKNAAKSAGVKVHGTYADTAAHHVFIIAEAKTPDQVRDFLTPVLTSIGVNHVHAVEEL